MKSYRLCLLSLLPALTVAPLAAAPAESNSPPAAPAPLFPDAVIAKGKEFQIKRSELDDAFMLVRAQATARGQAFPESQRASLETRLLQMLIGNKLLVARATAEEKVKAREQVETYVKEIKQRMGSDEMFALQLKALGLTEEKFRENNLTQAICEIVVDREVRTAITVSDADAKKYYDDNTKVFEKPEQVRAAHVLIGTKDKTSQQDLPADQMEVKRKLAESVMERAKKGEDFAKLAKEFSEDPGSKDKGGEYTFPRGQMVPEFEAAAFSLATNQVSDLVKTQFGYHIIKVLEKLPAAKVEYAKAEPDIKRGLQNREVQQRMQPYLDKLKSEADIQILDEKLKPEPEPLNLLSKPPAETKPDKAK